MNGKLTNSAQPIPKRRYNKKMVNVASGGGDQDPPQGSGTVAENSTHVSTSTQGAQDISVSTGSAPIGSSQAVPENTSGTIGTVPVSGSTTMPSLTSASEIPPFATNAASQLFTPGPSSALECWRPNNPYGMPHSYMVGLRGTRTLYTAPNPMAFFPNVGSIGRSAQNTGFFAQIPPLTTSTQAAF